MSIKTRVEDAMILWMAERPSGSLLSALTAISATSRRRYPHGTPSATKPGTLMGDREAFETFFADEMPRAFRIRSIDLMFRGEMVPIQRLFYTWLRCSLVHEGDLPDDITVVQDADTHSWSVKCDNGALELSTGMITILVDVAVGAIENSDLFGSPPQLPASIDLPSFELSINFLRPS